MQEKGAIISFRGEHRFLSNFFVCDVKYEGRTYRSSEHAYQAAKCTVRVEHDEIVNAKTPGEAKKLGRKCCLRDEWEKIKAKVMWDIVKAKFEQNYTLRQQLLQTGEVVLVEGNRWHDNQFGVCYCDNCNGHGLNLLGRTLMYVRDQLRNIERVGKREWLEDKDFAHANEYKFCVSLFDPDAGRLAMTWINDDGSWCWDTGTDRGRVGNMKQARVEVERRVKEWIG